MSVSGDFPTSCRYLYTNSSRNWPLNTICSTLSTDPQKSTRTVSKSTQHKQNERKSVFSIWSIYFGIRSDGTSQNTAACVHPQSNRPDLLQSQKQGSRWLEEPASLSRSLSCPLRLVYAWRIQSGVKHLGGTERCLLYTFSLVLFSKTTGDDVEKISGEASVSSTSL